MNLTKIIFLFAILSACTPENEDSSPWFSNNLYSAFSIHYKKNDLDSLIVVDKQGKRSSYLLDSESIGSYPKFYKDRLVSLIYGSEHSNLISFNLKTHQTDTICSDILFLKTSAIDEYEGKVVIRDYDSYAVVDMEKKKLLKQDQCYMDNLLLVNTNYFLIKKIDDISEPKPFLCRGSIYGTKDSKLIDIPGMGTQYYPDATTYGWNGMAVSHGFLFIHTLDEILAYDMQQNRIIDKIAEGGMVHYQLDKANNPAFSHEKRKLLSTTKTEHLSVPS